MHAFLYVCTSVYIHTQYIHTNIHTYTEREREREREREAVQSVRVYAPLLNVCAPVSHL